MWICSQRGFFSIVKDTSAPGRLLVRARDIDHMRSILGHDLYGEVVHTPDRDYPYRVSLPIEKVVALIGAEVEWIDYPNFKARVDSKMRGSWYALALHEVWEVLFLAARNER